MLIVMADKKSSLCSLTSTELDGLLIRPDVPGRLKSYLSAWRIGQYDLGKSHILGTEPFLMAVEDLMNALSPEESKTGERGN